MLTKKILLADDAELLRVLENSFFHRVGFSLLVAARAEQAQSLFEEQDPSLAILTLDLPGDAESFCRQVKRDPLLRTTPILMVVPAGREEEGVHCRQAGGCDDLLLRPIDGPQLLAAACRLLGIVDRTEPRVSARFLLQCGRDPRKLRPGRALNLNAGGLFVETDRLHPIHTLLTLEFTLPGSDLLLRCQARVAWVNHPEWVKAGSLPSGMGLQFVDLPDTAAEAVRACIEQFAAAVGGG